MQMTLRSWHIRLTLNDTLWYMLLICKQSVVDFDIKGNILCTTMQVAAIDFDGVQQVETAVGVLIIYFVF